MAVSTTLLLASLTNEDNCEVLNISLGAAIPSERGAADSRPGTVSATKYII